ncbi:hypothetical protein [Aquimarina muelleri]|uniref:Uncharacterized protein n=1 Tax=Aquimarina muelleri TaxID=279356 RepID=A0A918N437_9FLAO|nr:hypothetical protein [Aquimarina muelleri]MCX2762403.1 hypothetical protein [Aquimarina muelleri]GGX24804.1 hypothetical protein GCM10007384_27310 [Aquimarina muelleri]
MGLKEKRFSKTFQEEKYPALKEEINKALGFDITIEVAWDTLFEDRFMHLYEDTYPKIYFQPLVFAFTAITVDELGKEALQESLHKIVICNTSDHHNPERAYSFTDGVLTVDFSPVLNADKIEERTDVLQQILENAL